MILIEHAMIWTGEAKQVIREGYVLVDGNRIAAVGEGDAPEDLFASGKKTPEAEKQASDGLTRISGKNKLLVPGLVNAHCHIPMTLLRNYADDLKLQDWLFEKIFPVEDRMVAADIAAGTQLGLLEMIASGTTAFADMYYFCDETAKAVEEAGIRCFLTRGLMNPQGDGDFHNDSRLMESIAFAEEWNGRANGRITAGLGPHSVYTCTPAYLSYIAGVAMDKGYRVHVHLDETANEHEACLKKYGKTPARHLGDLGIFDVPALAAHCVHVTEEDLALMKEKGVSFVHNPSSNLKLASGIAPVEKAIQKGINVALGTDGASSNNNLDMWEEINLAALIHKGVQQDPLLIPASTAFRMATANSAAALGLEDCGVIRAGALADLVLLDLDQPHFLPVHNPVSLLAYGAHGSDVSMTMADGKVLYRNGTYLTLDVEKIKWEVGASVSRLFPS